MVKAQGNVRLAWDLVIIVFSIYQSITIPVGLSFDPDFFNRAEMRTLDSFIDLIFITDIIIRFRTAIIDTATGEEIIDFDIIFDKYFFSITFVIDVVSTIPIEDIFGGQEGNPILASVGLLKILRIFKISTVIMNLNIS